MSTRIQSPSPSPRAQALSQPQTGSRPMANARPQPSAGHSGASTFEPAAARERAPAGDPNAQALVGLKRGSGDPARIKQLQDDLISGGFLDASVRSNPGYGNTFGPMTEAAVKRMQTSASLPATGAIDQATAKVLQGVSAPPIPPPGTQTNPPAYPGAAPGDANSQALLGLQSGASGADAPRVKQLHDDLMRMGYFDGSFTSNPGYGQRFGPLTEAAVKQFQSDNGIQQTGTIDAATANALSAPRPRAEGIAVGPARVYRDQLGLAAGPLQRLPDGSVRQDFDRGSVQCTPDGTLTVTDKAGAPIAPPQKLGAASSVEQANQSFLSQWGATPWNSAKGAPYGYSDCGPTSCAMVLSSLGMLPHPAPADAEKVIDQMRDAALGYDSSKSQDTNDAQLMRALRANGAQAQIIKPTLDNIDTALAAGHPLIVGSSRTWPAWGQDQRAAGQYLNSHDPGGHYVTVLGKSPDGNYIVGDPLSSGGAIEVSPAKLQVMAGGSWSAIEVSRP